MCAKVNWRPHFIAFTKICGTKRSDCFFSFLEQLGRSRGLVIATTVVKESVTKPESVTARAKAKNGLSLIMARSGVQGFCQAIVARSIGDGMHAVIENSGLGALAPNTVMMGWPTSLRERTDERNDFLNVMAHCVLADKAVMICKGLENFPGSDCKQKGFIDVWWIIHDGGLLLLLAFLLQKHPVWQNCKLRVFTVARAAENSIAIKRNLTQLLYTRRIPFAVVDVIEMDEYATLPYTDDLTLREEARELLLQKLHVEQEAVLSDVPVASTPLHLRTPFLKQASFLLRSSPVSTTRRLTLSTPGTPVHSSLLAHGSRSSERDVKFSQSEKPTQLHPTVLQVHSQQAISQRTMRAAHQIQASTTAAHTTRLATRSVAGEHDAMAVAAQIHRTAQPTATIPAPAPAATAPTAALFVSAITPIETQPLTNPVAIAPAPASSSLVAPAHRVISPGTRTTAVYPPFTVANDVVSTAALPMKELPVRETMPGAGTTSSALPSQLPCTSTGVRVHSQTHSLLASSKSFTKPLPAQPTRQTQHQPSPERATPMAVSPSTAALAQAPVDKTAPQPSSCLVAPTVARGAGQTGTAASITAVPAVAPILLSQPSAAPFSIVMPAFLNASPVRFHRFPPPRSLSSIPQLRVSSQHPHAFGADSTAHTGTQDIESTPSLSLFERSEPQDAQPQSLCAVRRLSELKLQPSSGDVSVSSGVTLSPRNRDKDRDPPAAAQTHTFAVPSCPPSPSTWKDSTPPLHIAAGRNLGGLISARSSDAKLVILSLCRPLGAEQQSASQYFDYIDTVTNGLQRVVLVHGTGQELVGSLD